MSVSPSMSGRPEVEQDQVGPARLPAAQRRARRRRLLDVDSRGGEVADDAPAASRRRPRRPGRSAGAPAPVGSRSRRRLGRAGAAAAPRGRSRSIASPPSSLRRASTRPPIASTRPRTTASPMPVPEREPPDAPGHAVELVEQPRQRVVRHARPAVLDRQAHEAVAAIAARARPGSRVPAGVYLTAFSSDVRDAPRPGRPGRPRHGRRVERDLERPVAEARRSRSIVRPTRSSSSNTSRSARSTPASIRRMSSRFVTSRFRYSTSRSIASALSRWSASLSPLPRSQRPGGGADRRERRPQVVRDRLRAAPTSAPRSGGRSPPPAPRAASRSCAQGLAELVGGGREQARLGPVRLAAAAAPHAPRSSRRPRRRPRSGRGRRRSRGAASGPRRNVDAVPPRPASRPAVRWRTR